MMNCQANHQSSECFELKETNTILGWIHDIGGEPSFGSEEMRRSYSGRGKKPLTLSHSWHDLENIWCCTEVKNPFHHKGGAYGRVWRASSFISCPLFAFLEGCLSMPLLLVCRTEALLVIPSRWELDSQNGPLHLFFAFVLLLSCSPLLLPPCGCCLPAGVTEPPCRLLVPQSLAWIPGTEESLSAWCC